MHNLSNEYLHNEFEFETQNGYELSPEFEYENTYAGESSYEYAPGFEFESSDGEVYEYELTQELMQIQNEYEFGNWLKKLASKGAGLARNVINSSTGAKAINALSNIASKTLPSLASRAGSFIGRKAGGVVGMGDAGARWGQKLGGMAANAAADRYPQFVKFAKDTLQNISNEVNAGNPAPAVKPAIVKAAAKHYPIILKVKGTLHARQNDMSNEFDNEFTNEFYGESNYELDGEIVNDEATFNEVTEMELASELLNVQSEAELDQFLGKLFKKAAGAASKFIRSGTGRALGGMLKGIAKKALPVAGGALGSFIAPGIGTAIGSSLGSAAGNLFELELEGLSPEDKEFELSRAYVRFAGNAARRASKMPGMNPAKAARQSIIRSARRYAPGLLISNHTHHSYPGSGTADGTWYRDNDNRIVIEGA